MDRIGIATIIVTTASLLASCEGARCADGYVKDKSSGQLLDSVYVNVVTGATQVYTDSTGEFKVCNQFGGCVPRCHDIMIEFSKQGYKQVTIENPNKGVVVYLEKL
jgi:hypothetical protein